MIMLADSNPLHAQGSQDPLLPESTDYNSFIEELKVSLEKHHLPMRAIDYLFGAAPAHAADGCQATCSLPASAPTSPQHL